MEYLPIEKTFGKKGTVKVRGWIHRIRKMKDKVFIVLRDSSDVIQCVVKDPNMVKAADELLVESSLEIEGKIYKEGRAPTGYEIEINNLKLYDKRKNKGYIKLLAFLDRNDCWRFCRNFYYCNS